MQRYLTPIVFAALLAGCASTPDAGPAPDDPSLDPHVIKTVTQTMTSYQLQVAATVKNPRETALTLSSVTWSFTQGGVKMREGTEPLSVTVAPGGSEVISVPVAVEYASSVEELQAMQDTEALEIVFDGQVAAAYGPDAVTLPFNRAGEVRTPRIPKVRLATPDAARESLEAIGVEFPVEIVNDNPFEVIIGRLGYILTVEGVEISGGALAEGVSAPASGAFVQRIPADLTLETLPEMNKLLKEKNALSYNLKGSLTVGDLKVPVDLSGDMVFTAERE